MRPPYYCNGSIAIPRSRNLTSNFLATPATANATELWTMNHTSYGNVSHGVSRGGGFAWNLWVAIIIYSAVFVLGLVGNSLVIATLVLNKRMSTVTNYFLLSLAASDLMVVLVCIPLTLIGRLKQEFIFGSVMCKTMAYLMGVSVAVSTFTLVAISLERYYAICSPLRARGWQTKSHAGKVIAGIWTFSFLIMIPLAVYHKVVRIPIARLGICTQACRIIFPDQPESLNITSTSHIGARQKAWYVFQLVILLCIPGFLMCVAYACICKSIYRGFRVQGDKSQNNESNGRRLTSKGNSGPESHSLVECGETSNGKTEVPGKDMRTTRLIVKRSDVSTSENSLKVAPKSNTKKRKNGASASPADESRRNETRKQLEAKKKVVEMLIVIVFCFFVCLMPSFVANVWKAFDPLAAMRSLRGIPIIIIQVLPYVSTCINPVVYCFLNNRFRRAFLNIFCICCGCLPDKFRPSAREASRQAATLQTSVTTTSSYPAGPSTSRI